MGQISVFIIKVSVSGDGVRPRSPFKLTFSVSLHVDLENL